MHGTFFICIKSNLVLIRNFATIRNQGTNQRTNRQQIQKTAQQQTFRRSPNRSKRHRAGNRPWNQWSHHNGGILQINNLALLVVFQIAAQLISQHNRQCLITGNRARNHRRDQSRTKHADVLRHRSDKPMRAIQQPRFLKIPEYDEEMQTISITLIIETMPPPSINDATWAFEQ